MTKSHLAHLLLGLLVGLLPSIVRFIKRKLDFADVDPAEQDIIDAVKREYNDEMSKPQGKAKDEKV